MAALDQHPTVVAVRTRPARPAPDRVSGSWLREICLAAGADDVGFVAIDRTEIAIDKPDILKTFPATKTLISIVCRMNREPVRNPARSVANLEFHRTGDHVNDAAHEIVRVLEDQGIRAMNAPREFLKETRPAMIRRKNPIPGNPVQVAAEFLMYHLDDHFTNIELVNTKD